MSASEATPNRDELQFDRVETDAQRPDVNDSIPAVICEACGQSVGDQYYHVNGKPVCATCRAAATSAASTPRGVGPFLRAGMLGVAAAIAGAAIYYAVIAITEFEIGLVAIVIGYMVGWAVRKGAAGRGGRRFQVLALILTYWAVGLAYAPLAFKGMKDANLAADSTMLSDSTAVSGDDSAAAATPAGNSAAVATGEDADAPPSGRLALMGLAMLFVFVFALPAIYVVSSLPGGLISALIVGIGMRQAWVMTGSPPLEISGPYKVGAGVTSAAA